MSVERKGSFLPCTAHVAQDEQCIPLELLRIPAEHDLLQEAGHQICSENHLNARPVEAKAPKCTCCTRHLEEAVVSQEYYLNAGVQGARLSKDSAFMLPFLH